MKYLHEYRDPELVQAYLEAIHRLASREWTLMEFCGGQTHSLVRNGIIDLLPDRINILHGPGCPVCVTPVPMIDQAIALALDEEVILCSFGDMLRVPGSQYSLLEAKAAGGEVRILYSPLEAVTLARENPDREVVFFAVGFETTAPANALAVLHAQRFGLKNFSLLSAHVVVPPAMQAVVEDADSQVNGFLGAGNVCSVMGLQEYQDFVDHHHMPVVVTGFEPVDLLQGILMAVIQLEAGESRLENQYSRVAPFQGNPHAKACIRQVFEPTDREWRGMGVIPRSGLTLRPEFAAFDAARKFNLPDAAGSPHTECIAGEILKGHKKPRDCPHFGKGCVPSNPMGAPMVSSEGACAAYYHFALAADAFSEPGQ